MNTTRHLVFVNEFFHPDICASAAVLADRLPRILELRPEWTLTVIAGNRAWHDPSVVHAPSGEHRGVRIVRVNRPALSRTRLIRRAIGFAAFQRGAVRAARDLGRIDLVVGTTAPPQGGEMARKIADRSGCPFIYAVLDLYPDLAAVLGRVRADGFVYRRWLARDLRTMRDAAAVVSVAERITERIAETRGIARSRLRTIHDGFDPAAIEGVGRNDFKAAHNPDGRFVVQYAGNMGLSHPFETILGAAGALADDPGILFQFIGDGPQRPYVARHLPANAQLIDYQPADRLGQVLATADVCLISQHDGMYDKSLPYKFYATLAAGKPAIFIGNAASEIARRLVEAGAGIHVNQGDVRGLTEAVRSLSSDRARADAMGRSARLLLDERFHSARAARCWADLMGEVTTRNDKW